MRIRLGDKAAREAEKQAALEAEKQKLSVCPPCTPEGGPIGKKCIFLCGSQYGITRSSVDPSRFIEWEYPDGSGTADMFCANTYRYDFKAKGTREEVVNWMNESKDNRDQFHGKRKMKLTKAQAKFAKGTWNSERKGRGSSTKKLERQMGEYESQVSKTAQKKLGHKRVKLHGQDVVIMPAAKGTPWKLQPKFMTNLLATERIHSEDSDDSEDVVDAAFDELCDEQEAQLEEATRGAKSLQEMIAAVQAETKTANK
ncbi:unnamed protein product, partial [Prorocentrum cordatum]